MTERARKLSLAVRTGERVFLRFPVPSDSDEIVALRKRSLKRLKAWDPKPPKGMTMWGPDWFARLLDARRSPAHCKLLVCELTEGTIVGGANINEIVRGPFNNGLSGWWIGDPYEGKGYMTEALHLLLEQAFIGLRLHRLEANLKPENERSRRLAERVGFRREGFSPRYLQINGDWADHERYAVTVEEWREMRRAQRAQTPQSQRTKAK